jgi:hypothetical protein
LRQAWVLALVGGIAWGAADALSALANPGSDPLPWGVVVVANVAVGLVVVPLVVAIGVGLKVGFEWVARRRSP